jgi:hypothetical protein
MDFVELFLSFLCAFIVKDFYDIFFSSHIRKFFEKNKVVLKLETLEKSKRK